MIWLLYLINCSRDLSGLHIPFKVQGTHHQQITITNSKQALIFGHIFSVVNLRLSFMLTCALQYTAVANEEAQVFFFIFMGVCPTTWIFGISVTFSIQNNKRNNKNKQKTRNKTRLKRKSFFIKQ